MPRKLHYLTSSGQDICGEYYSSSACGLGDDTDFEWDGTHKKEMATCKRCIAALLRQRRGLEGRLCASLP